MSKGARESEKTDDHIDPPDASSHDGAMNDAWCNRVGRRLGALETGPFRWWHEVHALWGALDGAEPVMPARVPS